MREREEKNKTNIPYVDVDLLISPKNVSGVSGVFGVSGVVGVVGIGLVVEVEFKSTETENLIDCMHLKKVLN